MSKTILVIGGTGMLGEPVARRLAADGYGVRILTRSVARALEKFDRRYEILAGDVSEPRTLEVALEGVYGVHINLLGGGAPEEFERIEHRGTSNVARAAARLGVRRLTYLSGATVFQENSWFPRTRAKMRAEEAIRASGVPYTIFCATWFMESLRLFVRGRRAFVFGRQTHPWRWVAADDYARMVSRAFDTEDAGNRRLFIHGPQAYTLFEALERYCASAAPGVAVTRVPLWLSSLTARVTFDGRRRSLVELMRYFDRVPEGGDPAEADRLLGAPSITLDDWSRRLLEDEGTD